MKVMIIMLLLLWLKRSEEFLVIKNKQSRKLVMIRSVKYANTTMSIIVLGSKTYGNTRAPRANVNVTTTARSARTQASSGLITRS